MAVRPLLVIRPASDDLRSAVDAFCDRCSDDSLFRRFHGGGRGLTLRREVERWLHPDAAYQTVVAWADGEIHGVANLAIATDGTAQLAVLVEDAWQRQGLARRLLGRITQSAVEGGYDEVTVDIQPDNHAALSLLGSMATDYQRRFSGGTFEATIGLPGPAPKPAAVRRSTGSSRPNTVRVATNQKPTLAGG